MLKNQVRRVRRLLESARFDTADDAQDDAELTRLHRLAEQAQMRRDWPEARNLWAQVTERDPTLIGAWLQLGNMHNECAAYAAALRAFGMAAQLDSQSFEAVAGRAGVHERTGDWGAALTAWQAAIGLLPAPSDPRALHAYAHAVQAAFYANDGGATERMTTLAAAAVPGFLNAPENLPLRAKLLKTHDPRTAKSLLKEHLKKNKNDKSAMFDYASICLDDGDYEGGLDVIAPCLETEDIDGSFLWLAADLYERRRQWSKVLMLCQRMAARPDPEVRFVQRGFEASVRLADLVTARQFARMYTRLQKELVLIDRLRGAYEDAAEFRRARLLCRWLVRSWPDSRWHLGNLILLTAKTQGLPAADYLVQSANAHQARSPETDRAYCQAAFDAGEYSEARRRLDWYLSQEIDTENKLGISVLIGYTKANVVGLDIAQRHFLELASSTFQSKPALVGLAHMAMRRRDARASLELWSRISSIYPEDTISRVESARATYNFLGDGETSQKICEDRLKEVPSDVTMGEFYVWLLVAIGKYQLARSYLPILRREGGESWAGLEASIHSAGHLGTFDEDWKLINEFIPPSSTEAASGRLYHIIRMLKYFDRLDLAHSLLNSVRVEPHRLAWLVPYTRNGDIACPAPLLPSAQAAWKRTAERVNDLPARRLATMSQEQIRQALSRPRHEQPVIHIVNKFEQARGGSELHALDVGERIGHFARVEFWAPEMPHPEFTTKYGVKSIDKSNGCAPYGGTIVLIGVYFQINWIINTHPSRVIILYNTFESPELLNKVDKIFKMTGVHPELIYCSDLMRTESGLPGIFEPSPIDINQFAPVSQTAPRPFTLGRHSRDVPEKHHPQDDRIYRAVGDSGGLSVVLGGTCMRSVFGVVPGLQLLPPRSAGIVEFLQGLDAYLYRTSTWVEPWGRVVIEAMACGLPVLVHDVGGYAQAIKHEESGLLFHTTDEAVRLVKRLAAEPLLRQRLGSAARATVEELLGKESMDRLAMFYLMDSEGPA